MDSLYGIPAVPCGQRLFSSQWNSLAMGGGRDEASPDRVYLARANSLREANPLSPGQNKLWAKLSIQPATAYAEWDDPQGIQLTVTPSGTSFEGEYRDIDDLIRWSQDSKTVTLRLPNATISVTLKR